MPWDGWGILCICSSFNCRLWTFIWLPVSDSDENTNDTSTTSKPQPSPARGSVTPTQNIVSSDRKSDSHLLNSKTHPASSSSESSNTHSRPRVCKYNFLDFGESSPISVASFLGIHEFAEWHQIHLILDLYRQSSSGLHSWKVKGVWNACHSNVLDACKQG